MNYLQDIINIVKRGDLNLPAGKCLNIVFLLKDFMCQDAVPLDSLAPKLGVKTGEIAKAGTAPRLAHARSEIYWLNLCFPYLIKNLLDNDVRIPIRFIIANPEALTLRGENAFIAHPTIITPKGNIQDAVDFYKDFIENGEKEERSDDFIFRAQRFFHVSPQDGYLPVKENTMILSVSSPNEYKAKVMMALGLQQADKSGATVFEKPCYWFPDYMFKTHGFADAKAMAAALMPEHYPPTCSGRILFEALQFLKRHQYIVLKPSSGANGYGVHFFDIRGLKGDERTKKLIEFEMIYKQYLTQFKAPVNIIVQPYIEGIHENGEVRVFIYDGKILPVGVRLYPTAEKAVCKIFLNAKLETFFLTEEYLEVATKFIERSKDVDLHYFGLDFIKSKGNDGFDKIMMTEANFLISGFFDHIAMKMDNDYDNMVAHVDALPEKLSKYIETSYLNATIYKIFYKFINKFVAQKKLSGAHSLSDDILKAIDNMKEKDQKKSS